MDDPSEEVSAMTSIGIAVLWTTLGVIGASLFAAFLLLMSSGGVTTPHDMRAVPLVMCVTFTPLMLCAGWVPVVWARHRGGPTTPTRMAGYMIIAGVLTVGLNTILLPISFMIKT